MRLWDFFRDYDEQEEKLTDEEIEELKKLIKQIGEEIEKEKQQSDNNKKKGWFK